MAVTHSVSQTQVCLIFMVDPELSISVILLDPFFYPKVTGKSVKTSSIKKSLADFLSFYCIIQRPSLLLSTTTLWCIYQVKPELHAHQTWIFISLEFTTSCKEVPRRVHFSTCLEGVTATLSRMSCRRALGDFSPWGSSALGLSERGSRARHQLSSSATPGASLSGQETTKIFKVSWKKSLQIHQGNKFCNW